MINKKDQKKTTSLIAVCLIMEHYMPTYCWQGEAGNQTAWIKNNSGFFASTLTFLQLNELEY